MAATTAQKKTPTKKAPAKASEGQEFAVIATGGKQYQVAVGETIMIEKIAGFAKGDTISFDHVLLVDNGLDTTIGTPYITGAVVSGEVAVVGREAKVNVIKYKQKSRYFKKNGHRQPFSKVTIGTI